MLTGLLCFWGFRSGPSPLAAHRLSCLPAGTAHLVQERDVRRAVFRFLMVAGDRRDRLLGVWNALGSSD